MTSTPAILRRSARSLVVLAALMGASAALAQAKPPAPTPAKPATPTPAAAAAPATPAAPASNSTQLGVQTGLPQGVKRSETQVFGNWTLNCQEFTDAAVKKSCTTSLQLVQATQQGPQPLLTWVVGPDASGALALSMLTPTGVLMEPGVTVKIGKGSARKLAYAACEQRCSANMRLDDALLKEVGDAESAETSLVNTRGETITFNVPLAGFAAAWAAAKR